MNFKSGRIDGLEGISTEICEQVNSYLQCIKYYRFPFVTRTLHVFHTIFLVFVEQGQNKYNQMKAVAAAYQL